MGTYRTEKHESTKFSGGKLGLNKILKGKIQNILNLYNMQVNQTNKQDR